MSRVTKEILLAELDAIAGLNKSYLTKDPTEIRYHWVEKEIERFRTLIEDHYPLTDREKSTCGFGLYAVRELEGVEDDLAGALIDLHEKINKAG
jgi:hypothetical protein